MKYRWLFFTLLVVLLSVTVFAQDGLPYQNPDLPIDERVEDLLGRMSLEEKIGQMTLIEKGSIRPNAVFEYYIGGVLSGGGGYPTGNNSASGWMDMVHAYQDAALDTPLAIPMIYGVDAVHGHSNLGGAVIFPHNVGLGATGNAELVEEIGRITALEMIGTGIYWNYSPVLAVPQDIRWGRTYEGYGENTALVTTLSSAMLRGLQGGDISAAHTVLGTPKHFVGDGGAAFGTSTVGLIDRGVTEVDEETLRRIHLAPYYAAIESGARSIMISYSSWGGLRMHGQKYLITDVLINEMGFEGFIVSDWAGIDDVVPGKYYESVVAGINAGIDMNMVPYDYVRFINTMLEAVGKGDISMERIDQAVANILRVKFEMGLFERPYGDEALQALIGSDEHRAVAREAVSQSLVLLKNENGALPLAHDAAQTVFISGAAADNVGIQNGGWTIEWQGVPANVTKGTTIRRGLEDGFGDEVTVRYSQLGRFSDENGDPARADIGIVVVGEQPYAEMMGDNASLALSRNDRGLIESMRAQVDTLIVVLISGRPMIIDEQLNMADAFVAAWLPGTEGNGVSDVLFGDKPFVGKSPYTWPRTIEQLPFDFDNLPSDGCDAPLFPYGYGLTLEGNESTYLDLALDCGPVKVEVPVTTVSIPETDLLVPEGEYGINYNVAFPVAISLDGVFDDWAGVPLMTLPHDADLSSSEPALSFGAVADDTHIYFYGNVIDEAIISGEHGDQYWNEDSLEVYINASGDLSAGSYSADIAQITVPAINLEGNLVLGGINSANLGIALKAVLTETGWAVEMAIPLENTAWSIDVAEVNVLGFQVHLNGASSADRDIKLIWSLADAVDTSYQNPAVFGQLTFMAVDAG